MPLPKNQKPQEQTEPTATFAVSRIRMVPNKPDNYYFTLTINGVDINGARYITYTAQDGSIKSMIGFPSYKGSDNKYYNHCWYRITDADQAKIEELLAEELNK